MELAPRNKELYKNLYKIEFPSIKMSPFDAEFDSASNGNTFVHGKTIGENFTCIFIFLLYVCIEEKNSDEIFLIVFP
jgi:hypothetical protein